LAAGNAIERQIPWGLDFKGSLFAGVLDGGAGEIHLGGSRLTRFMESVERVTGLGAESGKGADAAPVTEPAVPVEARGNEASAEEEAIERLAGSALTPLPKLGLAGASDGGTTPRIRVEAIRDDTTGERWMKLPMPKIETVDTLAAALGALLRELGES